MFELDETPTKTAQACRRLVLDSGLPIERPGQEDPGSVTVVVYRWDPCDGYSYLTVSQGVRQVEPMYGPIVSDDQRLAIRGHAKPRHHRLGFKKREHTVGDPKQWPPEGHTRDASWYILVSFREEADRSKLEPLVDKLVPKLAAAIDGKPDEASTRKAREPLFPSLWHAERVARDRLRRAIRDLGHGWDLWKWAHVLTEGLRGAFHGWLPDCHEPHLGIYLFTGEYWALCGEREGSPWRPTEVHSSVPPELRSSGSDKEAERMNAFDWVQESCRPLLLRRSMHPIWRQRLDACGPEIAGPPGASRQKKYGGTCIVPLLDPFEFRREDRALGLIVLTALRKTLLGPGLTPGHLWLLSHLATSVSGYLAHLFAAPGFRYWPEAKVGCGRDVTVDWLPSQTGTELAGPTQKAVRRIVQALAPEGSTIQLQPLEPGRRSDAVCRLDVQDSDKLREIPRLLKLGPPDEIEKRIRYYMETGGGNGRFILYLCSLSAQTPPEHVEAAVAAVKRYRHAG